MSYSYLTWAKMEQDTGCPKKHPNFDCFLLTSMKKNQNVLQSIVFNSDRNLLSNFNIPTLMIYSGATIILILSLLHDIVILALT